ncbi:MAG TPA: Rsd/AlgQ family anti-sigma factor [Gammaproteobacteria bacterium]|nr:Rsd/AlgQ family anti-sigma factor [Gammaproteobacteria bacterium]
MQAGNTTDRRKNSTHLINNMLDERKQLLALLMQLSELDGDNPDESDGELVQEFCQVLVDYIAAGHFGLYQRIASGTERRKEVVQLSKSIYRDIEKTTQAALDFNEKYDIENRNLSGLPRDLSSLGEQLTTRIELEDQLIARLL